MNLRPRFSIRTLLVLVTLAGLYFGCWEMTKRFGLDPLEEPIAPTRPELRMDTAYRGLEFNVVRWRFDSSPAPFVITRDRLAIREYHLWFFGYTTKLPFERQLKLKQLEEDLRLQKRIELYENAFKAQSNLPQSGADGRTRPPASANSPSNDR